MKLKKVIEDMRVIGNPSNLKSVNSTTFLDTREDRYLTSTTKGLKRIYNSIGMFDNVFVDKLRKLDQEYSDNLVDRHLSEVDDDVVFFEINSDLRVLEKNCFDALMNFLKKLDEEIPHEVESIFSKDMLYIDTQPDRQVAGKYFAYNFINSKIDATSYLVVDSSPSASDKKFYGLRNYTIKLDNPYDTLDIEPTDVMRVVNDSLGNKMYWKDIVKIIKGLKAKGEMATELMVESPSNLEALSDYSLYDMGVLIYESYIQDTIKMIRYIEQFDYAYKKSVKVSDNFVDSKPEVLLFSV